MKKVLISQKNAGNRIDKFLMEEVFFNGKKTRGEIIRKIKNGEILLNGGIAKPSYALKIGDEIKINIQKEKEEVIPNKNIKLEIIHQDKNIIIVNKPSGMSVHPNDSEKENTLVNALVAEFPEIKNIYPHTNKYAENNYLKSIKGKSINRENINNNIGVGVNDGLKNDWMRPGIVHRLDKDTSGVMVVAKNIKTFNELKKKFANREIEKNYVAVVYGHLKEKKGTVDEPIARSASFKKQKIARGKMKGTARPAVTEYKLLKRYEGFDFVEALPKTGRMHQIRVHMAFLGNPIVGDDKYTRKDLVKPKGITRQLLHAQKLKFELGGKKYRFKAEAPKDFIDFLKGLDPVRSS